VNRSVRAALVRFAALGGMSIVPVAANAQLKCLTPSDPEIRSVAFSGNQRFSDDELRRHVISEPTDRIRKIFRKFFGTQRCLRLGLLPGDSARLKAFYSDQGFPTAIVRFDTVRHGGGHWVDINFSIVEGAPVTIDSVSITGLAGLGLGDDLSRLLHSKVGARYSPALVQTDVDSIETRLRNSGYPQGVALADQGVIKGTTRARVALTVVPGPKTRIGSITIVDTAITGKGAVINEKSIRQLLTFKEGDLYSERALNESQRQLYQLGTFYHAEVADTAHHAATDSVVNIHVLVVEDYMRQLNYRGGWGTQDCFQTGVQYFDKAFAHTINRFEMNAQISKLGWAKPTDWRGARDLCHSSLVNDVIASSKLNYTTSIRLTQPAAFGGRLDRSFAAYSEVRGAYKAYSRTTLIGGAASLSKVLAQESSPSAAFKRTLVGQLGYNLEYGHTDAPPAVLCFIFRACTDPERNLLSRDRPLAIISGVASRDWRDNPLVPHTGTLARIEGRLSSKWLGSDTTLQFRKGVADLTWYHPAIKSDVLAIRFRGGIIGGGGSAAGARLVPQQERLYTGGETSVRGFPQNELGPLIYVVERDSLVNNATGGVDTVFAAPSSRRIPTGGNSMMVWNFEYRIHGPFFGDRLQTILFADAGKLWTRGLETQPFKWTPGVAFRVFSPVGPIQVNVGYNDYGTQAGPVFFDPGISGSSAPLVCVVNSAPFPGPSCPSSFSVPRPSSRLARLHFSIAFPPDY
jgi:outer membrane protein insertion porin family